MRNSRFWQWTVARATACRHVDRWLLLALAIGVLSGLQGFGWGRFDCLNLDRMAFQNVMSDSRRPLEPETYVKPPFYTYLNLVLARWPADFVARQIPGLERDERRAARAEWRVRFARVLNLALFAGLIVCVFLVARSAFGIPAARLGAMLLATSAGFLPYQVFLTTDLALVTFLAAAFALACRILNEPERILWSVLAGLAVGLATAVKYNGLALAVCLPLAHLLASKGNVLWQCLRRPSAWLCGLAVPVGFVLGNPYAVLDWPKFQTDFLYNYAVTPVYSGAAEGNGYAAFVAAFGEIFGWPGSALLLVGLLVSVGVIRRSEGWRVWLLAAAFVALYTWKIGAFPRVETRFVLPVAPFVLLLALPGLALVRLRGVVVAAVGIVCLYNFACLFEVGRLFREDPRQSLLAWAASGFAKGNSVESSGSVPQLRFLPGLELRETRMPAGTQRATMFAGLFAGDPAMLDRIRQQETTYSLGWFEPAARRARGTDWVVWSNIDLDATTKPFYGALLAGRDGTEIAWDAESPQLPRWAYPRRTEFLRNRTTVFRVE